MKFAWYLCGLLHKYIKNPHGNGAVYSKGDAQQTWGGEAIFGRGCVKRAVVFRELTFTGKKTYFLYITA
jgi:hypothetical protein